MADAGEASSGSSQAAAGQRRPVTVVTGGTEGIGLELAREFARAGNDLLLVARDGAKLERAAGELRTSYPVTVHCLSADLSTLDGCEAIEKAVEDKGLYVHYLVNNAGFGLVGMFAELDRQRLQQMVDLNVGAVTDITRRFLPGMIERGGGGVLNLGSLAGFAPGPFQQTYYATKAYVISLTQAIAYEVRGTGVRVSVVTPGPVATGFHARMGAERAYYMLFGMMQPRDVASVAYAEFMRGRRVIAPGILNKIHHLLLRLMPRIVLVPFMGLILRQRARDEDAEANR